ncbi:uncharacterized protein LOC129893325 [Solanum dulcamara]|uniref:uncharacterized protein LOC129893325 n=1 Tax=Solanum dulcamara TaxID=45834 RepID=UPI002486524B|nr:uncharacterized protein LOC129893325 [Solanum dulcamara]
MGDTNVSYFEANTIPSTSRTPVSIAMATAEKPEKFTIIDFKCWQQKMFFYLTTLSLQRFINEDDPVIEEGTPENEKFIVTKARTHFDFLCKNYILNGLEDGLYNVFSNCKTSKELWYALEKKYETEDAGLKKFVAATFLDYKMVDSKIVMSQIQELQVIIHDLLAEDMIINRTFQVVALNEKLPPSWTNFKNYLKHKRKEITLEDLIVRLRIQEDNKAAKKNARRNSKFMGENIEILKWWLDSGAMSHVCAVRKDLATHSHAAPNETIYMENSAMAKVEGYERQIFKEAMSAVGSSYWKEDVNSEIDSILSNHPWKLVDLPLRNKPLGSKWIFKRMKADGTIDKYKERLVVK